MKLETFEERLMWARRQHAKITQRELSKRMKENFDVSIGANYISEIELGKGKRPTFDVVRAIAGAMGVSLDWLARFSEDMVLTQAKEQDATYFSEEADEVALLIDKMSPDQRAVVLNLTRSLASTNAAQKRLDESIEILDSVERKWGKETRAEVERIIKDKDVPLSSAT